MAEMVQYQMALTAIDKAVVPRNTEKDSGKFDVSVLPFAAVFLSATISTMMASGTIQSTGIVWFTTVILSLLGLGSWAPNQVLAIMERRTYLKLSEEQARAYLETAKDMTCAGNEQFLAQNQEYIRERVRETRVIEPWLGKNDPAFWQERIRWQTAYHVLCYVYYHGKWSRNELLGDPDLEFLPPGNKTFTKRLYEELMEFYSYLGIIANRRQGYEGELVHNTLAEAVEVLLDFYGIDIEAQSPTD